MKVEEISISDLTPYKNNSRKHGKKQIQEIAESIKRYGFNDYIAVWGENNIIVEGHGRLEAAKLLGMDKVPCIRLDHLTDKERREYTIAHNRTAELSEWDNDILSLELDDLNFDFDDDFLGLSDLFSDIADGLLSEEEPKEYEHHPEKFRQHNLEFMFPETDGKFDIPIIYPEAFEQPSEYIGFNYAKTCKDCYDKAVHFYLDDYQFERLWNRPDDYIELLKSFKFVFSPDFSLFIDYPFPLQIYNHYRKHWLAAYWQSRGIKVIPTICWGDEKSFEWCFDGEPVNSAVTVSSVGTQNNKQAKQSFLNGYNEMIKRLNPSTIIFYGDVPEECRGSNILHINSFADKFRELK